MISLVPSLLIQYVYLKFYDNMHTSIRSFRSARDQYAINGRVQHSSQIVSYFILFFAHEKKESRKAQQIERERIMNETKMNPTFLSILHLHEFCVKKSYTICSIYANHFRGKT